MKSLILGGVKSGKSRYAERLATQSKRPVTMIATAQALDAEMERRIARHKADRSAEWSVLEVPVQLSDTLRALSAEPNICVIVDCLTLWLTNVCTDDVCDAVMQKECANLIDAVESFSGDLILVSNEINMGVTPMGELSRVFCDGAGLMHQNLAQVCNSAVLVVAGLPLTLK